MNEETTTESPSELDTAGPELLGEEQQRPMVTVNGKPELILPSDNQSLIECGRQCFEHLATTGKSFLQGSLLVELKEKEGGQQLVEITAEAFRSRLEEHFELRARVRGRDNRMQLVQKLCSVDSAKALLKTSEVERSIPPIQRVVESPVFLEDKGSLVVLSQGYHRINGGTYVVSNRKIIQTMEIESAVASLLGLVKDFSFASPGDKSRCVAGFISPALRFAGLLKADFPLDLCEADQSQAGKGFRVNLISKIYGEQPCTITLQSSRGVGSVDESVSAAILSAKGFVVIDNMRGVVNSQLLESAIKGTGGTVMARTAYGKSTQVKTDHVVWMGTSNRAETTEDLANRCIITRLRKRPLNYKFREYKEGGLLEHVEENRDFYLSCIFAVVRHWFENGKPCKRGVQHDFREWYGVLDWIVQSIFHLPPLLEGHRDQQERISSPGLNFLRDVCNAILESGRLHEGLNAGDIATELEIHGVDIPGKSIGVPGATAVGKLFRPVFQNSNVREIEEFKIRRTEKREHNAVRNEYFVVKRYWVSLVAEPLQGLFKGGDPFKGKFKEGGYEFSPDEMAGIFEDPGEDFIDPYDPDLASEPEEKPKVKPGGKPEAKRKPVSTDPSIILDPTGRKIPAFFDPNTGKTFSDPDPWKKKDLVSDQK